MHRLNNGGNGEDGKKVVLIGAFRLMEKRLGP